MSATLILIQTIIAMLPGLVSLGVNVADLVAKIRSALTESGAPDDAAWAALDAQITGWEKQLNTDPA